MNCFYFKELTAGLPSVDLEGDELRHIVGSRRLKVGDKLLLFNDSGLIANVEIETVHRHRLSAAVINVEQLDSPEPQILLASAIPKGERISSLLDMSTQLGMSSFIPLICERSSVRVSAGKLQRYNRICINACKQSRRYFVPAIHAAIRLPDLLEQHRHSGCVILAADPRGMPVSLDGVGSRLRDEARQVVILVGPEGGFSETEAGLMDEYGVIKIKLSDAILRIETACVCALSQLQISK